MNLNINTGEIRLTINNDENKVITFNPTDVNFAHRFYELLEDFKSKQDELIKKAQDIEKGYELDEDEVPKNLPRLFEYMAELDLYFRGKLDYVFGEGTSEKCFGTVNVMSMDNEGNRIILNFLDAITPFVANERNKELEKHTGKYKKNARAANKNKD